MKRVIYELNSDKSQISNQMAAGVNIVRATLFQNNEFKIFDVKTKQSLIEGKGITKPDALRKIKQGLKKLGVVFEDEIRNKRSLNLGE